MSETTAAPAAPSLAHLPYETRVRIAVAECLGATWRASNVVHPTVGTRWKLVLVGLPLAALRANGTVRIDSLPDYLDDPAAWGALMEKERIDVEWYDGGVLAAWGEGPPTDGWPADAPTVGAAVVMAVLAKYGREVKP